ANKPTSPNRNGPRGDRRCRDLDGRRECTGRARHGLGHAHRHAALRRVPRALGEPLMRSLATDTGCGVRKKHDPGHPRRAAQGNPTDYVRRFLELTTGVEAPAVLVAALCEASRGHPEPGLALLRQLLATGGGPSSPEEHVFRREGEYWTIAYAGEVIRLRDT